MQKLCKFNMLANKIIIRQMKSSNLNQAFQKLWDKIDFWMQKGIEMIPNLLVAIIILIFFHFISKLLARYGSKILEKFSDDIVVNRLVIRLIVIITVTSGAFVALGVLHLDKTVTSLLAGIGIIGLALSFAFQHTAADVLSGLIVVVRSTVNVGDLVESNGVFGNVVRIGLRSMRILNVHGQHEEIPNRLFLDNSFKEYSQTGFRRIDIKGVLNYDENLTELKTIIQNQMADFDFVHKIKKPNMVYNEFHNEKVDYNLRVWMNFTTIDGEFVNARSACIEKLSEIFKENNIKVPRQEIVYIKE